MKKLTITPQCKPPTTDDKADLKKLLAGLNEIFVSFLEDFRFADLPKGLEGILEKQPTPALCKCNRMVAFITFTAMGPWAEITFSEGKSAVWKLTISFDHANRQFLIIAK